MLPLLIISQIGIAGKKPVNKKVPMIAIHRQMAGNGKKMSMFISRSMAYVGISRGWKMREIILKKKPPKSPLGYLELAFLFVSVEIMFILFMFQLVIINKTSVYYNSCEL